MSVVRFRPWPPKTSLTKRRSMQIGVFYFQCTKSSCPVFSGPPSPRSYNRPNRPNVRPTQLLAQQHGPQTSKRLLSPPGYGDRTDFWSDARRFEARTAYHELPSHPNPPPACLPWPCRLECSAARHSSAGRAARHQIRPRRSTQEATCCTSYRKRLSCRAERPSVS